MGERGEKQREGIREEYGNVIEPSRDSTMSEGGREVRGRGDERDEGRK